MCSLLFLNGLANAPGACRLVLRTSLRRRATYCLAHLPLGWFRAVQSLDVADSKRHSCFAGSFSPRLPSLAQGRAKKTSNPGSRMGPLHRTRFASLWDGTPPASDDVVDSEPHSGFAGKNLMS